MMNILKKLCVLIIMLVPCLYFGIKDNSTMAGIILVSSALTICFFNLDKFSYFKGAGFEAKLKDTVEKVIKPTLENQTNEIKEIKSELSEIRDIYWKEIGEINKTALEKDELAYDIKFDETSLQILDIISKDIKYLQEFIDYYHKDVNIKRNDLVKQLEEKGVHIGAYDYDVSGGDFMIGLANTNTSLSIRLKKLEIKLLEYEIVKNPKNFSIKARLKNSEEELKKLAENSFHVD